MTTLDTTAELVPKSVLYVEDDATLRETYVEIIKYEGGFQVTAVDNLQDAEEQAKRQKFDIYLVDGNFPLQRGGVSVRARLSFYDKIREMYGSDPSYAIISNDGKLLKECRERCVKFLDKGSSGLSEFRALLRSL